ncbi:hypothetical protein FPV67DRAFT_532742 [Lyophyllum atratum]|nr:hypothetical protein FPV67DRAFT_532742 [Lyophyllum atratum]
MSIRSNIPQEIIDKIIEAIDDPGRQKTLNACSTVASSFCGTAQKELYRSIFVSLIQPQDNVRAYALARSLMSSDRLRSYVGSMSLKTHALSDVFPPALPNLNRLRSLRLSGIFMLIAPTLPSTFYYARLGAVLQSSALRNVCLSAIYNFPVTLLLSCHSLETLEISRSTLTTDVAFDDTNSLHQLAGSKGGVCLRTLIIRRSSLDVLLPSALLSPSSPLHVSGLRKLHITVWKDATVSMLNSMLEVTTYLEELAVDFDFSLPPRAYDLDLKLGGLRNLECVEFGPQTMVAILYVAHLCTLLSNSRHLGEVGISVNAELCSAGYNPVTDKAWTRIDELLTGTHCASPLRQVQITEIGGDDCLPSSSRVFFERNMPRLTSMGALRVKRCLSWGTRIDIL